MDFLFLFKPVLFHWSSTVSGPRAVHWPLRTEFTAVTALPASPQSMSQRRAVLLLLHALMYWHISQHASEGGGERRREEGLRMELKIRMLWGTGEKKERERGEYQSEDGGKGAGDDDLDDDVSQQAWLTHFVSCYRETQKTRQIRKHKHLFFLFSFYSFFLSVFSMLQCYSERVAEAHALFGGAVNGSELMCSCKGKSVSRTCLTIWFPINH